MRTLTNLAADLVWRHVVPRATRAMAGTHDIFGRPIEFRPIATPEPQTQKPVAA